MKESYNTLKELEQEKECTIEMLKVAGVQREFEDEIESLRERIKDINIQINDLLK